MDLLVRRVQQPVVASLLPRVEAAAPQGHSVAPYVLLITALAADGIIKQLMDFNQISYVPLFGAIAVFLAWGLTRPVVTRPQRSVLVVVGCLAAWSTAELFNPLGAFRVGAGPTAVQRFLPIVCLWLAPNLLARKSDLRTVFRLMSIIALATAVLGTYENSQGLSTVAAWGPGFSPYRAGNPWYSSVTHSFVLRPSSIFSAPALAAEFCVVSLIASGWLVFDSSRLWRAVAIVSMAASLGFVAISGMRTVEVQLAFFVVALALLTTRMRRIMVPTLLAVVALASLYSFVPAVSERLGSIADIQQAYLQEYHSPAEAFQIMAAAPLGTGFGTSWDARLTIGNIENYYVVLCSDLGFPGVILMVVLIGLVAWRSLTLFSRCTSIATRFLAAGFGVYSLSLYLVLNTGLQLDKPTMAWVYWTLAGLVVAAPPVLESVVRESTPG